MKYLLQIDFPYSGPFGSAFFDAMKELAEDIATVNGLVYKLWTENEATQEAGGIYVFDNLDDANRYLEKPQFGIRAQKKDKKRSPKLLK